MPPASVTGTRFAHNEGHCFLAYSPDGGRVLTCGSTDGEVRVFRGFADGEEKSHLVGDEALALACSSEKFFSSANLTNSVQAFSLDDGSSEGTVLRFTADPTCVDVAPDGSFLVAGAEDMTVKVVRPEEGEITLEGHEAPVLSVSLDTSEEERKFVVSSSCDGTVRVWRVSDGVQVKSIHDLLPKCADVSTAATRGPVAWSPAASTFAVAAPGSVQVYERDTWEVARSLSLPEGAEKGEAFTALSWSGGGSHVAAATSRGNVHVWRSSDGKYITSVNTGRSYAVTALAWNPRRRSELSFIDDHGWWGVVENLLEGGEERKEESKTLDVIAKDKMEKKKKPHEEMDEDELARALFEDDDDEENSFSIRQIKRDTGFLSDEEDNSNLLQNEAGGEEKAKEQSGDGGGCGGGNASNENSATPSPMPPPPPLPMPSYEPDLQDHFQPSSTPSRLSSFFMVWNSVGVVRCINSGGDEDSAIEVEFHDTSVHHPLHISNALGHVIADLSATNLALACEADEEGLSPSRLVVHHFADQGREWSLEMPKGEEVMALCCADHWVAAATDRRRLRLLTSGGLQRAIVSIPGPIVSMAGHGEKLLIVVHGGMPIPGNQNLTFTILDAQRRGKALLDYQPLPMTPKTILSWVGFSDEGIPCTVDTAGMVRLFDSVSRSWWEACDTRDHVKGKSDHHFVVGASLDETVVRSVLCKGARYPQTVPRPTVGTLKMAMPLCEPASEKSMLEEDLLRQEVATEGQRQQADVNQTLMKLFALSVRAEQDARAVEVCRMMDTETIQVAMKYATRVRRGGLANKLAELACEVQDREEEEETRKMARSQSVDIFDTGNNLGTGEDEITEEEEESNPILAAKMRRESAAAPRISGQKENKNPFKKSDGGSVSSGSIRPGIVFDDITPHPSVPKVKEGFGSRKIRLKADKSAKPSPSNSRQATLYDKKTVAPPAANDDSTPLLKGFQLWLAEHRERLLAENPGLDNSDINAKGLELWKAIAKEEKDSYKTPRVPLVASSNKRKREKAEDGESSSCLATSKRKLAEFAAPD